MPLRNYQCNECGKQEEVFQWSSEELLTEMKFEKCEKPNCACTNKIDYSGIGIKFIGSGFYVNDYKK
jgi:predicted nucleic acid-binding Zn ribbon protein